MKLIKDTEKNYLFFSLKTEDMQVLKKKKSGNSHLDSVETNLTSNHEDVGLFPGLAQWVKYLALL